MTMNRRNILGLSSMTLLALAFVPTSAIGQQKTLREQLVGAWTLVSTDTTAKDGSKRQDFGANPKGILILDTSGRYTAAQERPDRPKFKASANVRLDTPAADYGEAARAFAVNFGTWSVSEVDKTLIRHYEGALIPNNEGLETKVSVSLTGDELKLSGVSPLTGEKTDTIFKRAK
jgi:Lipocalin-like domain